MYKIMAFNNGQPIILFIESEKVYMYTANGGRIYQKGVIFDDVGKDFDVFTCVFATHRGGVFYKKVYNFVKFQFGQCFLIHKISHLIMCILVLFYRI